MSKKYIKTHFMLKKLLFIGVVAIMVFTTIAFPVQSYAFTENETINNNFLHMVKQTDTEVIYEVEENEELLRYEEYIKESDNKTEIETNVYKIVNGQKQLVDHSKKEIIKTESQVEFINISNGESAVINLDEFNTTVAEIQNLAPVISPRAYSSWVKSAIPGINLGYRRDLAANYGDASYGTMTKQKVKLNNKHFDTFKSKVDSLKSRESSFVTESIGISAIIELVGQGLKGLSLSDIVTIVRKLNIPANLVWNVANWLWVYNAAINAWNDIPGSIKRGCNWSC